MPYATRGKFYPEHPYVALFAAAGPGASSQTGAGIEYIGREGIEGGIRSLNESQAASLFEQTCVGT